MTEEVGNTYRKNISEIRLTPSGGGVFEVKLGDEVLFSKNEVERFPNEGEVVEAIDSKELAKRADC